MQQIDYQRKANVSAIVIGDEQHYEYLDIYCSDFERMGSVSRLGELFADHSYRSGGQHARHRRHRRQRVHASFGHEYVADESGYSGLFKFTLVLR